jgi:hypothetical protein
MGIGFYVRCKKLELNAMWYGYLHLWINPHDSFMSNGQKFLFIKLHHMINLLEWQPHQSEAEVQQ